MKLFKIALLFIFLNSFSAVAFEKSLRMTGIFSDNMVLQANKNIPVWGWAEPGAEVKVVFNNKDYSAAADKEGRWRLIIKPLPAGGPFEMKIISSGTTIKIKNIVTGEVWLCSGQSNMHMALRKSENGRAEAAKANDNMVRCFFVEKRPAIEKKDDCRGKWLELSSRSANKFSAVSYYFAKQLRSELKVPVGLILSSWGGTKAECWMSMEGFKDSKALQSRISFITEKIEKASSLKSKKISPDLATALYNGMIEPFITYALAGVIWYQGENNSSIHTAAAYREVFPALIRDWRKKWQQGDFPFYYVQLPNFKISKSSDWPLLRESQLKTLAVPNTGMAVTIDIGDGLLAKGGSLTGFEIAGKEKKYFPADAVIKADKIIVKSDKVKIPIAVRYAWKDNPQCNLYNKAGLPASPFRTSE